MTLSAQIIHQDTIINSSLQLINLWRGIGWDLSTQPAPVPVANIVYDILSAAGVSDGALSMILGPDGEEITGEPAPSCSLCEEPANHLVHVRHGVRLACDAHAAEAREAGLTVTSVVQQ